MAATALVAVAAVIQQALAVLEQHVQLALKLRVQQRAELTLAIIHLALVLHVEEAAAQQVKLKIATATVAQNRGLLMVIAMMVHTHGTVFLSS